MKVDPLALDRSRRELLRRIAHDLRNLAAGVSGAVRSMNHSGSSEKLTFLDSAVRSQVEGLTRMIDDLADLEHVSRGTLYLCAERAILADLVDAAAQTARFAAEGRGVSLTIESNGLCTAVEADAVRVRRILAMLLTRAVSESPRGGQVRVSLREDGEQVEVVVSAARPSQAALGKQFIDVAAPEDPDAVALTAAREITRLHGGSIEFDGGESMECRLRLPRKAQITPVPVAAPSPPRRAVKRVLVAEDQPDAARTLSWLLEMFGCEVTVMHDGPSAAEAAKARRFDVVLLDVGLPGMDGCATARAIRQDGSSREALLIAVSGYGDDETRRRCREAGFASHLLKPVDHEQLLALCGLEVKDGCGVKDAASG